MPRPKHPLRYLTGLLLEPLLAAFPIVLHVDDDPDALVQAPPDHHPRQLLDRVQRLPVTADEQGHVVLVLPDDVDVHVVVVQDRLGDGIDAHVAQQLLQEVGRSVGLLLEVFGIDVRSDHADADDSLMRADAQHARHGAPG